MSGVILEDGRQYERCNVCGQFVLFVGTPRRGEPVLRYERPSEAHPHGRDVCSDCMKLTPAERDTRAESRMEAWLTKQLGLAESNGWDVRVVQRDHGRVIRVVGPFANGDRVLVDGDRPGRISSVAHDRLEVYVRTDDNPVPTGRTGAAEPFHRDRLTRA